MRKKTNLALTTTALVAVVAILLMMADPASATVHDAAILRGNISLFTSTGASGIPDVLPLAGTTGTGCGSGLQVTANSPTAGLIDVTTYTSTSRYSPTAGTAYIIEITRQSSTAGTYNDTTGSISSVGVTARMDIYTATNANPATDCTHGTTRTCRYNSMAFSLSGSYGGTLATPTAGQLAILDGTGSIGSATPPCNAPFTTLSSGTLTIGCFGIRLTT